MKSRLDAITDVRVQRDDLYAVLDELGIKYQKHNCRKCLQDLKAIALEELGVIASAADGSAFDEPEYRYSYVHWRAVRVDGRVYGKGSSQADLAVLYKRLGRVYVRQEAVGGTKSA